MNQKVRTALIAGGLVMASTNVMAESSVTLYGVIDTGVDWENDAASKPGQTSGSGSAVRMTQLSSTTPSRWGLLGKEDLGGGVKATFKLESWFYPNNGGLGAGRLFGREAWVGVGNEWGDIRLGHQFTMLFEAMKHATIMVPGLYSLPSLDPYLANQRSDNTIAFLGARGPLNYGVSYSFGRDGTAVPGTTSANGGIGFSPSETNCPGQVPGDSLACRAVSAMLGWFQDSYGASVSYDELRGGPGTVAGSVSYDPTSASILLPTSSSKTQRYYAGGYAKYRNLRFIANYIHRRTEANITFESNLYDAGISYTMTPSIVLDGEVSHIQTSTEQNATFYVTRATYVLSPRTSVYTSVSFMQNNSRAAYSVGGGYYTFTGAKQLGVLVGLRHYF